MDSVRPDVMSLSLYGSVSFVLIILFILQSYYILEWSIHISKETAIQWEIALITVYIIKLVLYDNAVILLFYVLPVDLLRASLNDIYKLIMEKLRIQFGNSGNGRNSPRRSFVHSDLGVETEVIPAPLDKLSREANAIRVADSSISKIDSILESQDATPLDAKSPSC